MIRLLFKEINNNGPTTVCKPGAAGPAISAISLIAIFSKDYKMYLSIFTWLCCRTFTISYKQMISTLLVFFETKFRLTIPMT